MAITNEDYLVYDATLASYSSIELHGIPVNGQHRIQVRASTTDFAFVAEGVGIEDDGTLVRKRVGAFAPGADTDTVLVDYGDYASPQIAWRTVSIYVCNRGVASGTYRIIYDNTMLV